MGHPPSSVDFEFEAGKIMPSSHPDTMHLVGSARLEVADILESAGLAPKDDQHHLSLAPQLRDIAQEYKRLTLENISMHANRDPVLITGADMMKALEKDLRDLGVRHHPIINLAPLTVQILHQATAIQAQLIEIYNDGSLVEWGAPQFTPHIHRAVFHGFKELLAENRAGFIGDERRGYLNQQFNQDIAELTRGGYNTVVILDDRCSSETTTLRHVRDRLARGQVGTLAFVVGHASVPRLDKYGQPYRDSATGVRVCAPIFRYSAAHEVKSKPAGVADELKDLGYGSAAGHCYLKGYNGRIAETFKSSQRAINQFIANHDGITEASLINLETELFALGVKVVNRELFHQLLYQKHSSERLAMNNRDLRELFSHDPRILVHIGNPDCNPNLASVARLPMLWPGEPTENSFHEALKGFDPNNQHLGWLRLSYHQLAATIDVVDRLTQLTGCPIPVSAFPFLTLDKVRRFLPESAWNNQNQARDVLKVLLAELGDQCGMPKVFHTSYA